MFASRWMEVITLPPYSGKILISFDYKNLTYKSIIRIRACGQMSEAWVHLMYKYILETLIWAAWCRA